MKAKLFWGAVLVAVIASAPVDFGCGKKPAPPDDQACRQPR
jgi:hypothetical protein